MWPGAVQGCVGNEWGVVVVGYVGETVHQSAPHCKLHTDRGSYLTWVLWAAGLLQDGEETWRRSATSGQ